MSSLLEITATYIREHLRFANDGEEPDTIIAEIELADPASDKPPEANGHTLCVYGPESCEFHHGLTYRFLGRGWQPYKNRTTKQIQSYQFRHTSAVPAKPHGKTGIVAYLARHGEGLGIGKGRATILYEAFGADAVGVCRENPEEAFKAVPRWKIKQAKSLSARLKQAQHIEDCSIELTELLSGRGFPKSTPSKAMLLWGNVAAEHIRQNPYRLMKFRGCGFRRCDAMYLDLGLPPGTRKRQALCAWHTLASDGQGHTWYPVEFAIAGIRKNVAGCDLRESEALKLSKRAGLLGFQRSASVQPGSPLVDVGGRLWVAEGKKDNHEQFIARKIVEAKAEESAWGDVESIEGITDHQREQLKLALAGPIGSLGGGPGTGKTFTAAALIKAALIRSLIKQHGVEAVAVAAPTGKAAVRISEAMREYGIPLRAKTIHSTLGVRKAASGSGNWGFEHDESNPLPYKFLIVDESSMIDAGLMASLLAARATGMHILFVGDVNQLPPVGHGAPLRDFITAGIPYGELTEIQRQVAGSLIVKACHAIKNGDAGYHVLSDLSAVDLKKNPNANLVRLEASNPQQQIQAMLRAIQWAGEHGFDRIWDVQVLAAVNAKSELSRKELNKILQGELNPRKAVDGCPFRVGDKIVNLKNGTFKVVDEGEGGKGGVGEDGPGDDSEKENKDDELYVANGDLAEVVEIAEKYLLARLVIGDKIVRVPRGKAVEREDGDESNSGDGEQSSSTPNTGCTWDLAYVLSVHKSQGSEIPVAILMLDEYPGAMRVASREWLYTGDSRGKKLQVEIGKAGVVRRMVRKVSLGNRKTFLAERIRKLNVEEMVRNL